MEFKPKNFRCFIGSKNYTESRAFYKDLGFEEIEIDSTMCLFKVNENMSFYLQDYYVKDWVQNSMLFLEVEDLDQCTKELLSKGLQDKYKYVRFTEIKTNEWGRVLYMHDPSGVLWHFCEFK